MCAGLCGLGDPSVSTGLPAALAGLRAHHARSWVGPDLERVWAGMLRRGELVVFELWLVRPAAVAAAAAAVSPRRR